MLRCNAEKFVQIRFVICFELLEALVAGDNEDISGPFKKRLQLFLRLQLILGIIFHMYIHLPDIFAPVAGKSVLSY